MEVSNGFTSASGHVCLPRGGNHPRGHADLRSEPKLLREKTALRENHTKENHAEEKKH